MYPKTYMDLFRSFDRTMEVFVAMPFSSQFEQRWKDIFKPAILSCGLKPYRTKERLVSDSIPIDVLEGVGRAKLLLFDISNDEKDRPNPNVMYELGIAHAIRLPQEVIIVRDEKSENISFDIRHLRWNKFSTQNAKNSRDKIRKLVINAEKQVDLTRDLMVRNVLGALDIDMISFLEVVRGYVDRGFDLCAFDSSRKGEYGLYHESCEKNDLRRIARDLINLGVIRSAKPIPFRKKVYGGQPEYYFTELGKTILSETKKWRLWAR
ncbi:MAG: hypothetical protein ABSF24_12025 [Candidatus Bathyarchaeia archaeon]|jgi:hypothetical protein